MGLFSSKKKTYVNTTVHPVFTEAQIPNSIKTGVFKSILHDGDLVDYVLEGSIGSVGVRADNGYSWAKQHYTYGVPVAQVTAAANAQNVVYNTLALLINQAITPDYYHFGPLNSVHYGWQTLVDRYDYDPVSNELRSLSATLGSPVYLVDMVATYRRATFNEVMAHADLKVLEQWGPSPSSGRTISNPYNLLQGFGQFAAQSVYEVSDTASEDYLTLTYEFVKTTETLVLGLPVKTTTTIQRGETVSMAALDLDKDYHQVRYLRADGGIGFFTYQDGLGTYPDIDAVQQLHFTDLGTYYPWTYLRYAGSNLGDTSRKTSQAYLDSVKWCSYLGVDYQTLCDAVDKDPNVGDVLQALMLFGVNTGATTQVELEYLFEYFSLLYLDGLAQLEQTDTLDNQFKAYASSPTYAQVIQDRQFVTRLAHAGISKRRVLGTIGKVGSFSGELISTTHEVTYRDSGGDKGGGVFTRQVSVPAYRYRRQVTSLLYEEVVVDNPNLYYQIDGKYGFSAGPGAPELLIPLDRSVVRGMSLRKKEELLCRALHMVVNTEVVVKTPWYASGWFKIVMIIVAIVITVVTAGGGAAVWASIAAMSATALTIAVIEYIVISLAVSYAMKLFVKAVGPEIGLVVAIAAIAYGGYESMTAAEGSTQAVWATRLLSVGSNLASATSTEYSALINDVQQEMQDFSDFAKGQFNNLKDKQDQLGLNANNHQLDFVSYVPMLVMGESPNDLYARTVHSGNIGVTSYDMVSGYVGTSLTLPTLNQTEEGFKDGWII